MIKIESPKIITHRIIIIINKYFFLYEMFGLSWFGSENLLLSLLVSQ